MRKAERIIRDKNKKVDTTVNGDAENLVEQHRETEKRLYPLRLNKTTVIYVTKDKRNEAYAVKARSVWGYPNRRNRLSTLFQKRTSPSYTRKKTCRPAEWQRC